MLDRPGTPRTADRWIATDAQIAARIARVDPWLDAEGLVDQISALLSAPCAENVSSRLLVAASVVLGVERSYLTDLEVADRSDCADITAVLAASGLRGQVRICRSTGAPGIAEIMMEILDVIVERTGEASSTVG